MRQSFKRIKTESLAQQFKYTGSKLSTTLNQDEAVSRGCALQCAMISPVFKVRDFAVQDWNTYPVELSWDASLAPAPKSGEAIETTMDAFPVGNQVPSAKVICLDSKSHWRRSLTGCIDLDFLPQPPRCRDQRISR